MKCVIILIAFLLPLTLPGQERAPKLPIVPIPKGKTSIPKRGVPSSSIELEGTVKSRIEATFLLMKESKVDAAFKKLFEGAAIAADKPELMTDLVAMTQRVLEKCGPIESTELLDVRRVGQTLREVTYIVNCAKRPMKWRIYAYYGEGRWQILDTNVTLEPRAFFEPVPSSPLENDE